MPNLKIWFLAYSGIQILDLTGPFEVFNTANLILDHHQETEKRYELCVVSSQARVVTSSGLEISASVSTTELSDAGLPAPEANLNTLLIPGGAGVSKACDQTDLVEWVRQTAGSANRVATVCTGAFLAGAADLLNNRRVTTHWNHLEELKAAFPAAAIDTDSIFVQDGDLWSSAGVTAGIDLALALVEVDFGVEVAQAVARQLVVFLRRPGGQSQFAPAVWSTQAESSPIRAAQELIQLDPSVDLSVAAIANQIGMSARHFSRLFRQEVGQSPGRYVEAVRISAARHHLEASTESIDNIATRCGFASTEVLRRAFHRQVRTSPDAYRTHHAVHSSSQPRDSQPVSSP